MLRHARVHFLRKTDEPRIKTVLPRLPRQVMRIERNAVTADSRPRIKSHEPERLGRGRANHFPRVDVERVAKPRHLIRHPDVDCAKRVFKQLRRFRNSRGSNSKNIVNDLRIKMCGDCC